MTKTDARTQVRMPVGTLISPHDPIGIADSGPVKPVFAKAIAVCRSGVRTRLLLPALLIVAFASAAAAAPTSSPAADAAAAPALYLSANELLALPDYDRELVITGLRDAYRWSRASGFTRLEWIEDCTADRPVMQLQAIFEKWLKDNPDRWQEPAAKLFPFALFQSCGGRKRAGE